MGSRPCDSTRRSRVSELRAPNRREFIETHNQACSGFSIRHCGGSAVREKLGLAPPRTTADVSSGAARRGDGFVTISPRPRGGGAVQENSRTKRVTRRSSSSIYSRIKYLASVFLKHVSALAHWTNSHSRSHSLTHSDAQADGSANAYLIPEELTDSSSLRES